jgi:hypothetical protein
MSPLLPAMPIRPVEKTYKNDVSSVNDYYIPQPRIELVKRLPMFSFPSAWNTETTRSQPAYLKCVKKKLLENMP